MAAAAANAAWPVVNGLVHGGGNRGYRGIQEEGR